ncbi:hypothetical protein A2872_02580 [Candidatus Gottesmanbacteria bacterium RIFCSPHIGHO2_01_FULL_42_12]|uniref:Uncharacterized protein n=1 Tax=Candidatus Gottesmanbacteria bacterium RIFCSPHIGHO2_01_FULL_42_12 TaxID=1798377 RepID=A0A1F5Z161_9BACT|nr:MAG: hypothetical protein A2872_02580 [Candidatus Gottesmanbacteria bacterium RIFCSPHIGHO2_01_FULL_42_12]
MQNPFNRRLQKHLKLLKLICSLLSLILLTLLILLASPTMISSLFVSFFLFLTLFFISYLFFPLKNSFLLALIGFLLFLLRLLTRLPPGV